MGMCTWVTLSLFLAAQGGIAEVQESFVLAGVGVSTQIKLSEAVVRSAGSCRVSSAENYVLASKRKNDVCAGQFRPFVFGR